MSTILQIETATQVCSVALAVNGKTIALKELMAQNIHANFVTLFITEVMETANLKFEDLDAIAVSKGPGSYTGLRIGVATAKGLCFALNKPLIATNTLLMMAEGYIQQNKNFKGLICPMIDARRMEVYTALYDENLKNHMPINAKIIDNESFKEELANCKIVFIGDGALKCTAALQHQNAIFSNLNYNSAANMSVLANDLFKAKEFEDIAYFEPFYLKDFLFTTPKKKI